MFKTHHILVPVLMFSALVLSGCGPETQTEKLLLDWAQVLNTHLATGGRNGSYSYPRKGLDEVDSMLSNGLALTDAWGNPLLYRQIRDDRYQLISAGSDGVPGNDDDVILENGAFYEPAKVYAERPWKP